MRTYVAMMLVGLAAWSTGCSDLKCLSDERKVGKICYPLDKPELDATTAPAMSDGGNAAASPGDASVGADRILATTPDVDASQSSASDAAVEEAAVADAETSSAPNDTSLTGSDAATSSDAPDASFEAPPVVISPPPMGCVKTAEVCGDAVDNDCNGKVDDGAPEVCNGLDDDCNPATPDGAGACGTYVCKNASCLKSCSADADCAAGLHCTAGSCEGTQVGAGCANDNQCGTGSCSPASKCAEKVALNGTCDSNQDCATGTCVGSQCKLESGSASCGSDDECASGVCVKSCFTARREVSQSCDTASDCNNGLTCNAGSCKRNLGQSCGLDSECLTGSCGTAGTCAASGGFGAACNTPPDCSAGVVCAAGACKLANGNNCTTDAQCGEGICGPAASGFIQCRPPGDLGSACNETADCRQTPPHFTQLCVGNQCLIDYGDCTTNEQCADGDCFDRLCS